MRKVSCTNSVLETL